MLYTQEGFLVWRLDNRGAFGRGHGFEAPIFGELGKAAEDDQLAGIEYLKSLPYVYVTRMGTDGKSFGGDMTLYAFAPWAGRVPLRRGRRGAHLLGLTTTRSTPNATCARRRKTRTATWLPT